MASNDLLNDFMKRRAQWLQRDAEVMAAFIALQRQVEICATIMRRDKIRMADFDAETVAQVQALGTRFACLRQALVRDYPDLVPPIDNIEIVDE